jgi:hypothetical protein
MNIFIEYKNIHAYYALKEYQLERREGLCEC